MPRKGRRRTLAPGIYEDGSGYEAQVNGGRGKGNSKRFKPSEDRAADVLTMRRWQLRRETELAQAGALAPKPSGGASLKTDVPAYLATLTGRTKRDAETLLDHWLKTPLANLPRHDITPLMLRTQIATWQTTDVAASTINHRLSALRALYRVLDENDIDAPNPTLKIVKLTGPDPEPREIPAAFGQAVFDAMPDRGRPTKDEKRPTISKTKLRLLVERHTGLPPKQIGQLQETHVDWRRKAAYVTPRRKGKGIKGKWLPLTDAGVAALRNFFAGKATGPYSTSAAAKSFHRAVKAAKALYARKGWAIPPLPVKLRPYDLRHTFLTVVFRQSRNPRAVQEMGMHSDPRTSDRYRIGAVEETTRIAVNQVNRWHRSAGTGKSAKKR